MAPAAFVYSEKNKLTREKLRELLARHQHVGIHLQHAPKDITKLATATIVWSTAPNAPLPWILHESVLGRWALVDLLLVLFVQSPTRKIVFRGIPQVATLKALGLGGAEGKADIQGTLDLVPYMTRVAGQPNADLTDMLRHFGLPDHVTTAWEIAKAHFTKDPEAWSRPFISHKLLNYTVVRARAALACYQAVLSKHTNASPMGTHFQMLSIRSVSPPPPPFSATTTTIATVTKPHVSSMPLPSPPPPTLVVPKAPKSPAKPMYVAKSSPSTSPPVATKPPNAIEASTPLRYVTTGDVEPELRRLLDDDAVVGVYFEMTRGDTPSEGERLEAITVVWSDPRSTAAATSSISQVTRPEPWVLHLSAMPLDDGIRLVETLLVSSPALKVTLGLHRAAAWLIKHGFTWPAESSMTRQLDLELYYEHEVDPRERHAPLTTILRHFDLTGAALSFKDATLQDHRRSDAANWGTHQRPPMAVLTQTIARAQAIRAAYTHGLVQRTSRSTRQVLQVLTARRWTIVREYDGKDMIWFDADHVPRSLECLFASREHAHEAIPALQLECEIEPLLSLLPSRYAKVLRQLEGFAERLVDVCLDIGRVPHAYVGRADRIVLTNTPSEDSGVQDNSSSGAKSLGWLKMLSLGLDAPTKGLVTESEIREILERLGGESKIGDDNRAGIDRQLHRISVMRRTTRQVYGLTLRVGRTLRHASNVFLDLLLSPAHREKSVLVLGRPGSGKTTLIRDMARCIAAAGENVCIIDTSNEIGGDGLVPHQCIGWARRMMVPSLDQQARIMVECVQNHTVETLVVDEIGRRAEVNAAGTVRQRGPRLIASAHGDFRTLLRNQELRGLLGGVQSVTLGDAAAKKLQKTSKTQSERGGEPIVDVIVELDHVVRGRGRIIWDVVDAVDRTLEGLGRSYAVETRVQSLECPGVEVQGP